MSDLSSTSFCKDNSCNSGISPMILILLLLCGGDNGIFGGCNGNSSRSCDSGGLNGILPILLILLLGGGSF